MSRNLVLICTFVDMIACAIADAGEPRERRCTNPSGRLLYIVQGEQVRAADGPYWAGFATAKFVRAMDDSLREMETLASFTSRRYYVISTAPVVKFTLIYKGRIPAPQNANPTAMRNDPDLQAQLTAIYAVTNSTFGANNKQIIGSTRFIAILPIEWTCVVDILFLRATPPALIYAFPDLDNMLKTLFDVLCAPNSAALPCTSSFNNSCFVLALEDKQLANVAAATEHHWIGSPDEDLTIIRVTTQETPIDDAVTLGGQRFISLRQNVF